MHLIITHDDYSGTQDSVKSFLEWRDTTNNDYPEESVLRHRGVTIHKD